MDQLAPGIYVESGFTGVTVGAIVGEEGILCIDTPTSPADARKWRQKLATLGNGTIRTVINLDPHVDRVLGNQWFDAPVIASEPTAERMSGYPDVFKIPSTENGADIEVVDELAGVRIYSPRLSFSGKVTLLNGNRKVHLLHVPGVNAGAVWAHLPEEQIVFVGDSVAVDSPPLLAEADSEAWLAALESLKKAPFRNHRIVPGRGGVVEADSLAWLTKYLNTAKRKVGQLWEKNLSRADVSRLVPEFLDYWEVPPADRRRMGLRLQIGLEHLWDEMERAQAG